MAQKKGKFLVIDGTDGSGKATQTKLLIERMKKAGLPVKTVSFPRYGEKSAGPTEDYLNGKYGTAEEVGPKRASVFYAIDRYAASFQIRQWLEEGNTVIADRYVASNMGHQGGKIADDQERKDYFRWNDELEYGLFEIPRPDLNLILRVPCEIVLKRLEDRDGDNQDIHQADPEHLKQAEKTYVELSEMFDEMILIDCYQEGKQLSEEKVHQLVWNKIEPLIRS